MHDGAVIIRDNKIAVSALIFHRKFKDFQGIWHWASAAIGLSEVSDAFTFVVSEETGGISITHNGVFKHDLSLQEFEEELLVRFLVLIKSVKKGWHQRILRSGIENEKL